MLKVKKADGTHNTDSHTYDGVSFPWMVAKSSLEALKTFEVRPDDIWIVSFPKSGTTWISDVVNKVLLKSGLGGVADPTVDNAVYVEFHILERPNYELLAEAPSPRVITCHVPPSMLPPQLFEKKPRILHVARNPKDACISYFYHMNVVPVLESCESFDDFLEQFLTGKVQFGYWPTHEIFWWKKRHEENVLFLKYEDMKKDLKASISKVNDLFDAKLSDEELETIAQETSIGATRQRKQRPKDFFLDAFDMEKDKSPFVREGKVGGWKNHLTVAQNERFDEWYKDVTGDSGLTFDING
ncbi:sulfotransferase 1E1-like isoform X2 [Glandiceps talaboti]